MQVDFNCVQLRASICFTNQTVFIKFREYSTFPKDFSQVAISQAATSQRLVRPSEAPHAAMQAKCCGYDGLEVQRCGQNRLGGPSTAGKTDFGSCRLGNCTFRKLPLGKNPLGKKLNTHLNIVLSQFNEYNETKDISSG